MGGGSWSGLGSSGPGFVISCSHHIPGVCNVRKGALAVNCVCTYVLDVASVVFFYSSGTVGRVTTTTMQRVAITRLCLFAYRTVPVLFAPRGTTI